MSGTKNPGCLLQPARRVAHAYTAFFSVVGLCGVVPTPAVAAEPDAVCNDSRVRVQSRIPARWQAALTRACARARELSESDSTARLRVFSDGGELVLTVVVKDGRTTERRLGEPEMLVSTMEALLALPAEPHAPDAALAHAPVAIGPPIAAAPLESVGTAARAGVNAASGVHLDLGIVAAARISGSEGYQSLGAGGMVQLRSGQWLCGITLRWDVVELNGNVLLDDFEMESSGAGFSILRRFSKGFGDIDLGFSPRYVLETQAYTVEGNEHVGSLSDVRVGSFFRASLGHGSLRPILELDAELSPSRLRRDHRIAAVLPALPLWSVGVGVGVAWEQL